MCAAPADEFVIILLLFLKLQNFAVVTKESLGNQSLPFLFLNNLTQRSQFVPCVHPYILCLSSFECMFVWEMQMFCLCFYPRIPFYHWSRIPPLRDGSRNTNTDGGLRWRTHTNTHTKESAGWTVSAWCPARAHRFSLEEFVTCAALTFPHSSFVWIILCLFSVSSLRICGCFICLPLPITEIFYLVQLHV